MVWFARKLGMKRKSRGLHPYNRKLMQPYRRLDRPGWAALDTQMALDIWMRVNGIR